MNSGIYKITNTSTGMFYIGRTCNWKSREKQHKTDLKGGYHHNDRLQKSWNKRGESCFSFELIWAEKNENLIELEQFILDELFHTGKLYNQHCNADGGLKGMVVSEETKEKQRVSRLNSEACAKHIKFLNSPENMAKAVSFAATPESRAKAVATRIANGHKPFSDECRKAQVERARVKLFAALDWAVENSKPRMEAIERFGSSWGSLKKFLPEWEAVNGKLNLPLRASGERNGKVKSSRLKD